MNAQLRAACVATTIAAAIALGACTQSKPEDDLEAARVALDKGALPEAVIHLKAALQRDAESSAARYLLGKALLQSGQPALAELELRKARESGYKAPDLQPLLAQALYESAKYKKLVDEFGQVATGDQAADRMVRVWVASAQLALGDLEATKSLVSKVLAEAPDLTPARLLRVRVLVAEGQVEEALKEVNDVLQREPKNTSVVLLAADLHTLGRRDLPGGLQLYERALQQEPRNVRAATGAFQILLQQRDLPGAGKVVAQIKKAAPGSPQTRFLEAQLAFANGDLKAAREASQQLLKVAPENVGVIQFAAMVELQSGAARQAESLFGKLLQKFPDSASVRTMLAEAQLKGGNAEKAQQTLQPLLNQPTPPKAALILSAEIALQDGEVRKAEALFQRAKEVEPNDVKVRTAMALIELSRGNGGNGLRELQAIADQQKASTSADMVLISALMSRGDFDGALKAVDALAQKAPDSPMVDMFRGRILLAKNDRTGARKAFEKSASTRPQHFPSMVSLALLDVGEGRVDAAQARYEAFLKSGASPQAISLTYRSMAGLKQASGASRDEVIKDLRLAVKNDPTNVPAWQMLIDELLAARDSKSAVVAAQEALAANPEEGAILDGLGRAQMYAGDQNQAAATFNRFVRAQPRNPLAHVRLGQAQVVARNDKAALASFGRALELDPANEDARKGVLAIGKRQKDPSELIALARDLQKRQPQSASGYLLEGELLMDRGEFAAAVGPFRNALGKRGEGRAVARVHTALVASGRQAEADRYEAERLTARPGDVVFRQYLADRALVAKDYARAEQFYQAVVKLAPSDAKAANNLAWLMIQLKKPGAIPYAQRASALSSGNPAVLDTLVSAYAAEGQGKQAVETARQALSRQPDNPSLQLSLAKTMLGIGESKFASELFASIEKGRGSAELKSEARRLAATL